MYTVSNLSWVQQKRGVVTAAVTTFLIPLADKTKRRQFAGLKAPHFWAPAFCFLTPASERRGPGEVPGLAGLSRADLGVTL